jgi:hypothetical protein
MPPGYECRWGINPDHAEHFRQALGLPHWTEPVAVFRAGLAACLVAVWTAYLAMLSTALAGGAPSRRWTLRLAVATVVPLALLGPPALSADVYMYVGYARLALLHHVNPYVGTQVTLVRLGDLTSRFLCWPIPSPYGPLWTFVSILFVAVWSKSVLWGPVVMFKILGAVSVLALAEGGRRVAERVSPGRGDITFAAVALNPLFLSEAVVAGHSDIAMMALVVWAVVLVEERPRAGFLLLGVAASIKFIPLLLAPWLLFTTMRRAPRTRWAALSLEAMLATVAPVVLTFAPFWRGLATLDGLRARNTQGLHPAGDSPVRQGVLILAIYAGLCVWIAASRVPAKTVLRAWIIASLSVIVLTTGMWFPWYFAWPLAASLILLGGWDLGYMGLVLGLALLSFWSYVR